MFDFPINHLLVGIHWIFLLSDCMGNIFHGYFRRTIPIIKIIHHGFTYRIMSIFYMIRFCLVLYDAIYTKGFTWSIDLQIIAILFLSVWFFFIHCHWCNNNDDDDDGLWERVKNTIKILSRNSQRTLVRT